MVRYLDATSATYSTGVAPRGSGLGSLQQPTFLSHLCFLARSLTLSSYFPFRTSETVDRPTIQVNPQLNS